MGQHTHENRIGRNVSQHKDKLAELDETERVDIDGGQEQVIFRALFESFNDDVESFIEDELDLSIRRVKHLGEYFGTEVELE
jgi:hypothetical protein